MKYMYQLFIIVFIFMASSGYCQKGNNITKPNIILIVADDLGYGDVGVFNQNQRKAKNDRAVPYLITPSLDKMATRGAMLTQQYVNAPVCVSSRVSLMAGTTQGHANVRNNQFDKAIEDNYTMASTLKAVGYTTIAIGKWGLQGVGGHWTAHPLQRGFDHYFGYIRHADGHEHYPKEGLYRGKKEVYDDTINVAPYLDKCYTGDLWTAKAKRWIIDHTKINASQPFFMYLAYDTPHAAIELPTQAYPAGGGLGGGLQWLGRPGNMINTASGTIDSWMYPLFKNATYLDKATGQLLPWKDVNKRYATVIQRLDAQIGDLLQLLKDVKIDENTLVVFATDNGPSAESYLKENYTPEFFNGYGPFDGIKRDTWEGGLRTPTIVQWPAKIIGNKKITQPSLLSDWMPTFLHAAGVAYPVKMDGISLLPVLTGSGKQQKGLVYVEYFQEGKTPDYPEFEKNHAGRSRQEMQMIRFNDFVGVRYNINNKDDDFEIYNVIKDPKEKMNIAAAMPQLQQEMKARVLQVRMPDTAARRPYDTALMPALMPDQNKKSIRTNYLVKGVTYQLFSGNFPWVPATGNLVPVKAGVISFIQAGIFNASDANVATYKGYIKVPENGAYTFFLTAKGKAFFRIHDAAVIDADYNYISGTEKSNTIRLQAGIHPFTITYKTENEKPLLQLLWSSNAFTKKSLTAKDFY